MGKTIAVSFEENSIKIVHASLKGNNLTIEKTEAVDYMEFDSYLQNEKATEFVVTYDFKEAFHGVIEVPAVKSKYLAKIVESEIRKATSLKDVSIVFTPLNEKISDNRKILEVFYFAINNEVLHDVVDKFYEFGKVVKAVYPTVFSAASLIGIQSPGDINLGVLGSERERLAFLSRNGTVYFIRNYESIEPEFSDYDIQNINMTISYCEQNFRMEPSSVMVLGNLSDTSSLSTVTSQPLVCLSRADFIRCDRETFNEYILPVASFYAPRSSNILNRDFQNIYMLNNYLAYAARVFVLLTVICAGLIAYELKGVVDGKKLIESMKNNNQDIERIFSEYSEREEMKDQYMPVVEFLNKPAPSIRNLLISLSSADIRDIRFNLIKVTAKKNNQFSVLITGKGVLDKYSLMQASFKNLIDVLKNIKGVKIKSKIMELDKKKFIIEMEYGNAGNGPDSA